MFLWKCFKLSLSLKVGMGMVLCYRFCVFYKNDIITKVLCLGVHRTRWGENPHFLALLIRFTSCCCNQLVCLQTDIFFHHINTLLFLGGGGLWIAMKKNVSLDYVSKFKLFMSNINISALKAQHHLSKFIALNLYLHLYCYQSFTLTPLRLYLSLLFQVH